MKSIVASAVCLAALCIVASCGGSSDGGSDSCGLGMCGGDIQGTWKITSSCLGFDVSKIDSDCPSATGSSSGLSASGTFSYGADMSYSETIAITGTLTFTLPASCLSGNDTCAERGAALMADDFDTATCVAAASGCACTFTFAPTPSTDTGTYTTNGGVLSDTSNGSTTPDDIDYCVKGTTLSETAPAGNQLTGSVVLTKQ